MSQTQTTATSQGGESFAALFEESLKRSEMRSRRGHHRRSGARRPQLRGGQRRPQVRSLRPDRRIQERPGRARSPGRRLRLGGHRRRSRTATATPSCRATRPSAWPRGCRSRTSLESGEFVTGTVNGKVKGGLTVLVNGIRAFLPGSLLDTRPVKDMTPVRGQDHGVQGHQARPQAQQRRVVAPRRGRGLDGRRARQAAGDAARRRDRQRRGQEHHRVRCVRRPRRHRRPAAHHRHGLAPRAPPERSGSGRPGTAGQGAEVRRREEPRLAGHQAAGRRPVARRVAPLPAAARACSARSPTSPTTARSSRSSRASKAWCTSPRWTGPTRTSPRPRSSRWATRSRSWCSRSTRTSAASAWA